MVTPPTTPKQWRMFPGSGYNSDLLQVQTQCCGVALPIYTIFPDGEDAYSGRDHIGVQVYGYTLPIVSP